MVAWAIYVLAWVALILTMRNNPSSSSPPPVAIAFYVVLFASALAMLVFWIGALIRLGHLQSWGWFVAVLVLHLVGLGIIAMLAYALVGPDDSEIVVTRPPMAT